MSECTPAPMTLGEAREASRQMLHAFRALAELDRLLEATATAENRAAELAALVGAADAQLGEVKAGIAAARDREAKARARAEAAEAKASEAEKLAAEAMEAEARAANARAELAALNERLTAARAALGVA